MEIDKRDIEFRLDRAKMYKVYSNILKKALENSQLYVGEILLEFEKKNPDAKLEGKTNEAFEKLMTSMAEVSIFEEEMEMMKAQEEAQYASIN